MQAPTGTASHVCGRDFTTDGATNAVSAPGRWALETIAVCGRSSSTEALISGRLSYSCRDTVRQGRPDSVPPGLADRTSFFGSRNLPYFSEAIQRRAGYLREDRPDRRELFPPGRS